MTLANLVDDILLEIRNSNIGESEKINKKQIEQWCNNYRAYLIKKYIDDKKESLDLNEFTQYYTNVKVNKTTDSSSGHVQYIADIKLPKLITTAGQQGIIKVTDAYGNILQIGNETKMKFQKYRKYTCDDYIVYVKDNKVYIENQDNTLEYINIDVVAENPADVQKCYGWDSEYPAPNWMIVMIKDLVFSKEVALMLNNPSDMTNDSSDDTQNKGTRYSPYMRRYVR